MTGVFAEPAGATTMAGLIKAKEQGFFKADDTVVMINTGSGLKDIVTAKKSVEDVEVIRVAVDDMEALEKAFANGY